MDVEVLNWSPGYPEKTTFLILVDSLKVFMIF